MKIAQISPLYESVPPKLYGGTERVVSYLTEELVKLGHSVTLFASGDSKTSANLISHNKEALRLDSKVQDPLAHHIIQMQDVAERAHEFDVLHFHTDYLHFPFTNFINIPNITTLHGRLDIPDLKPVYKKFNKKAVVSISNAQRNPLPRANWVGTVYHGLPLDLYKKGKGDGDYVAFIGRISPEKRPDRAIEIAKMAGIKLKIAAKIDKADNEYFKNHIQKLLDQSHVEFIGEIGEKEKGDFLGKAKALLFPIDWPEPFGMVMIESIACGTPVIAYNNGSVPEVIDNGQSGYVVENISQAVTALENINMLNRTTVRQIFEERFSATIMAKNYLNIYELLPRTKRPRTFIPMHQSIIKENGKKLVA
ncbi:glycosyltransferase family 4 protein [Cytophagaceae bacterium ABcell3]|nr:glycosyltransferase family 4 protein [Cytophagaceae bacterium ABcell3]